MVVLIAWFSVAMLRQALALVMLAFLWAGDGQAPPSPPSPSELAPRPANVADAQVGVGNGAPRPLAVANVAEVAPAAGLARAPRDHRSLKFRIQAQQARARQSRMAASLVALSDAASPSVQQQVCRVFSIAAGADNASEGRHEGAALYRSPSTLIVCDKRRERGRIRDRALCAHRDLVCERMPAYVAGAEVLLCSAVSDDATMWCRLPADAAGRAAVLQRNASRARGAARAGLRRKWRRTPKVLTAIGRNKAATCVTCVQHLFCLRGGALSGVEITSPCQTVPRANWKTLQSRKHQWAVWNGCSVGQRYHHPLFDVDGIFQAIPVIVMLSTNDAAPTNVNIRAFEEQNCQTSTVRGSQWRFHFDLSCLGHQVTLPARAAASLTGDLDTILVRLGHVLSTSTQTSKLLRACDAEVDQWYEHKHALALPTDEDYIRERSHFHMLLRASMVSMDFDELDAQDVFDFFNGSPSSLEITHICLRGHSICRFGCDSPEDGKRKAKLCVRKCVGTGPVLALAYRWQGMERACGWLARCRAPHDILARAMRRMWSKSDMEKAQELVDRANNVQDLSFEVKTTINASSILRFCDQDKHGEQVIKFLMATTPMQEFLNKVQAVDKSVCDLATELEYDPRASTSTELLDKCVRRNLDFVSGENGNETLRKYAALLQDMEGGFWKLWSFGDASKFKLVLALVRIIADVWRRLVFYFEQSRFLSLQLVVDAATPRAFDPARTERLRAELQHRKTACPACLCPNADTMLDLVASSMRLCHSVCCYTLANLRAGSAVCERSHLRGIALYKARQRGVAVAAETLAKLTYIKGVKSAQQRLASRVRKSALAKHNMTQATYQRLSGTFRVSAHASFRRAAEAATPSQRDRRVRKLARATGSNKRARRNDGYRFFRKDHFSVKAAVGTPIFKAEEQRVAAMWKALPTDAPERVFAAQQARAAESAAEAIREQGYDYKDIVDASGGALPQNTARRLRQQVFWEAHDAMEQHPAWQEGLAMSCPSSALAARLVKNDPRPATEIAKEVSRAFAYDPEVLENPVGAMQPRRDCCALNWGICRESPHFEEARNLSYNLWQRLRERKLARKDFPLLVRVASGSVSETLFSQTTLAKATRRSSWGSRTQMACSVWRRRRVESRSASQGNACSPVSCVGWSARTSRTRCQTLLTLMSSRLCVQVMARGSRLERTQRRCIP